MNKLRFQSNNRLKKVCPSLVQSHGFYITSWDFSQISPKLNETD